MNRKIWLPFLVVTLLISASHTTVFAASTDPYVATSGHAANPAIFQQAAFYKRLAPGDAAGWGIETSGSMEKVMALSDSWICEAGGYEAVTHYARFKYKAPEQAGIVLTTFYMKLVVVLPTDFYTQQKAGFRLMNTDNYTTTLNGSPVGASDANESRTSVFINSNHSLRVIVDHETTSNKILYISQAPLAVGQHTLELFGSLNTVAPWYLRVDGVVVASGTEMLSMGDTAPSERVATRFVAGIDGAADQDFNLMSVQVKSFEVANYDMAGVTNVPPTSTLVPATFAAQPSQAPTQTSTATFTSTPTALPSATTTPTLTSTALPPTLTPTSIAPTATIAFTATVAPTQAPNQPGAEEKYDDNLNDFVYSSGWSTVIKKTAYGGSFAQTSVNGSSVSFNFNGGYVSVIYKGGPKFGRMDVYFDGVLADTIDQMTSSNQYNLRWDYPVQFSQGLHTLKLVYVASGISNYGSLDAVIIH